LETLLANHISCIELESRIKNAYNSATISKAPQFKYRDSKKKMAKGFK
jgi:hypothetical protein